MCGLFGLATIRERSLSVDDRHIVRMRDRLTRRGPDDAGWWRNDHVAMTHRRLAIMDPQHGEQPMHLGVPASPEHRVLIYNGELYNAPRLRHELERAGARFETTCDTEVIARALDRWGIAALARLRGMFALAWYDAGAHELWLARDPLGIKPLVYTRIPVTGGEELAFASEPIAFFDHPSMHIRPDWVTVSAYLTSIRTTLDDRTMYDGVWTVRPGSVIVAELGGDTIALREERFIDLHGLPKAGDIDDDGRSTRECIEDAIDVHLLSDVGVCALLSGGLDSTIIANRIVDHGTSLRTYCAGSKVESAGHDDVAFARRVAASLGVTHTEVQIDQNIFDELWPWMIGELGVPLGTPNEVAIYALARELARHDKVVLSGEGADELFGGYGIALQQFAAVASSRHDDVGRRMTPATAYLNTTAWIRPDAKMAVLRPDVRDAGHHDVMLRTYVESLFDGADDLDMAMAACLRAQRTVNLTGLLGRLDTATMLASVEGRTPFADVNVARWAIAHPLTTHVTLPYDDATVIGRVRSGVPVAVPPQHTKQLLRRAFPDLRPNEVLRRPKASFPLPFQAWLAGDASPLWRSALIREVFCDEAIAAVHENPVAMWQMAWPMLNIAIWLDRIWGNRTLCIAA